MEAIRFKKAWAVVKFHTKVAWRGFCRTLAGAVIAGLVAMSVYGFISISKETGWTAVCGFVASCAMMIVALSTMYAMGKNKKGAKHG